MVQDDVVHHRISLRYILGLMDIVAVEALFKQVLVEVSVRVAEA